MSPLKIRYSWPSKSHKPYGTCALCSPKLIQFELRFDQGSVAPIADEILTGDSSEATGVVATHTISPAGTEQTETDLYLESGTWAGGDAKGFVVLNSCTGVTEDDDDGRFCFEDNEDITGDTAAVLVADDVAVEKVYMIPWPKTMLSKYEGKWYCPYHYRFRSTKKEVDKVRLPAEVFQDPIHWRDGQ